MFFIKKAIAKIILNKGRRYGLSLVIFILEIIVKNTRSKKDDKILKDVKPILKKLQKWT